MLEFICSVVDVLQSVMSNELVMDMVGKCAVHTKSD